MHHPRNHFLAHAAFPAEKHRHVHRCNLENLLADLEHLRAGGEERDVFRDRFAVFPKILIFRTQLLLLPALQDCGIEIRLLEWLGQIIEGA